MAKTEFAVCVIPFILRPIFHAYIFKITTAEINCTITTINFTYFTNFILRTPNLNPHSINCDHTVQVFLRTYSLTRSAVIHIGARKGPQISPGNSYGKYGQCKSKEEATDDQ